MRSPVYWNSNLYHIIMKMIYGKYYEARYQYIDNIIPENSSIFEACAGDCYLYKKYLRKKAVSYSCGDIVETFVKEGIANKINISYHNLKTDPIPPADYIILQASLYQFIPEHKKIVDKLLNKAQKKVIISEPIINLSTSSNPVIKFLAKKSADPGNGEKALRFCENSLDEFMHSNYTEFIEKEEKIPGGREKVYILTTNNAK